MLYCSLPQDFLGRIPPPPPPHPPFIPATLLAPNSACVYFLNCIHLSSQNTGIFCIFSRFISQRYSSISPPCISSTLVAPNRVCVYFLNRIRVFLPKYSHMLYFLKIYTPPPFSGVIYEMVVIPQFPVSLLLTTVTHPSPIYSLEMTWKPLNRRRTYLCSTSSREFEECLSKVRDHAWKKRSQNVNRKPLP